MKNVLILLRENLPQMNTAERAAGDYILSHPHEAASLSIHALADESFTSVSAVVRMCKSLGFHGYKDFRKSLTVELALQDEHMVLSQDEIRKGDSTEEIIRKITWQNLQSLQETQRIMDPAVLHNCAEQMQKADRVLLFGMGASFVIARDAYLKLLRINKPCVISEDWHLQLVTARSSMPKDLAIIISYSGHTTEMITCAKALRQNKTPILAITRPVKSEISDLADLKLYTTSSESLFRSAAMASRISSLNIIDILYTAYASMDYDHSLRQLRKTHIEKNS